MKRQPIRLVAAMTTRNEIGRYLKKTIPHLLTYVDEIRVQDDLSTDGTYEWLAEQEGVVLRRNPAARWHENEGVMLQALQEWAWEGKPTHVLAIDADEIVPRGALLKDKLTGPHNAFTLRMVEIWERDGLDWWARVDGGWAPHEVAVCYRVPPQLIAFGRKPSGSWRIWGRKMAGGRTPKIIRSDHAAGASTATGLDILHLGWSNPDERAERAQRYFDYDGGRYHSADHLASILDGSERLEPYLLDAVDWASNP